MLLHFSCVFFLQISLGSGIFHTLKPQTLMEMYGYLLEEFKPLGSSAKDRIIMEIRTPASQSALCLNSSPLFSHLNDIL